MPVRVNSRRESSSRVSVSRRELMAAGVAAGGLAGLPRLAVGKTEAKQSRGQADHCIFIWLGGGQAQIDTWDPKGLGDPMGDGSLAARASRRAGNRSQERHRMSHTAHPSDCKRDRGSGSGAVRRGGRR